MFNLFACTRQPWMSYMASVGAHGAGTVWCCQAGARWSPLEHAGVRWSPLGTVGAHWTDWHCTVLTVCPCPASYRTSLTHVLCTVQGGLASGAVSGYSLTTVAHPFAPLCLFRPSGPRPRPMIEEWQRGWGSRCPCLIGCANPLLDLTPTNKRPPLSVMPRLLLFSPALLS